MGEEFLSLREAAELAGVSRFKLWRLVRDGKLAAYRSELDRRETLVRRADVEELMKPRPVDAGAAKKAAA